MPLVRWLVVIVSVLAMTGQSLEAYAAAGVKTDVRCCCPDPTTCRCHDHDGRSSSTDSMGKCGGGEHVVALEQAQLFTPESPTSIDVTRTVVEPVTIALPAPEPRFLDIEKPPF